MDKTDTLFFFFTGLCAHFEREGVLDNARFANFLSGMLEDQRFNLSEEQKDSLRGTINLFLPIRAV